MPVPGGRGGSPYSTDPVTPGREPRRALAVAAAVVVGVGAVVARFVTTSPLWLDEALSVHIARLPVGDAADALRHDGHPPLYYWLLHGWMELFGEGDVAVRSLSGLAGVVGLGLVWLAGRRLGGVRVAWAAALVLAVSPYAVRYSTETRMYALVSLLVLAGHLLVRRAVDTRSAPLRVLVGVGAVGGALVVTHYWSLFLVAATALVLLGWGRRRGAAAWSTSVRLVAALAAGAAATFGPWRPAFLDPAGHPGTPWATAPRPTVVADQTLRELGGGVIAEGGLLAAVLVVLLVVGVLGRSTPTGLVLGTRPVPAAAGEAAVAGLTLAIGAAAGLATGSTYAARYAAVVLPLVVLVAARGLAVVPGRRPPLVVAALLVGLGGIGIVDNVVKDRTQAGVIVDAIRGNGGGPGDVVVACPDQLGPALRRELDGSLPLVVYPTLGDGDRVDWYDYEDRNDAADPAAVADRLLAAAPDGGRIWVAWSGSYRTFEGDCEALLNALAGARGPFRPLVAEEGGEFFEHAALVVFEA